MSSSKVRGPKVKDEFVQLPDVVLGDETPETDTSGVVWTKHDDATSAITRVMAARTVMVPTAPGELVPLEVPFVQSVHHQPRQKLIRRVVVHCTENAELEGMAMMNAHLFAGPQSPEASVHYFVDDKVIVQCVRDEEKAWHAPGANEDGIGVEIVGRASQSVEQWADPYSRAALYRAMGLIADVCRRHNIPVQFLDHKTLLTDACGITTHAEVTRAWPAAGHGHSDPGPSFPMEALLTGVRWTLVRLENPTQG